jgi:hypothetical protein
VEETVPVAVLVEEALEVVTVADQPLLKLFNH